MRLRRESVRCELVGFDIDQNTIELRLPSRESMGGAYIGQDVLILAMVECDEKRGSER